MQRRILLRLGSLTAALFAAGLLIFHAALLWRRLLDDSITEPAVVARWIASALLLAVLLTARRYRVRHLFLVFLLLAALLHLGVPGDYTRLVQVGLTAACTVLFSILLMTSLAPPATTARLAVRPAFVARRRAVTTQRDRSPPLF
jgi:hypothetical protein